MLQLEKKQTYLLCTGSVQSIDSLARGHEEVAQARKRWAWDFIGLRRCVSRTQQ